MSGDLTARETGLIAAGEVLGCINHRGRDASRILVQGAVIAINREDAIRYATKLANDRDGIPWVGEPYFKEANDWWMVSFKCTKVPKKVAI